MNTFEQPQLAEFDFGMEDFDINAAFQEAMLDVITREETELEEKIRLMETIVTEGTSDVYRDFVDFRMMAAQMEMMCNHVHGLEESMRGSDVLNGFMQSNSEHDDDHGHDHDHEDDDDIDPKTGKKKKRRRWF